ncbi:hypothetical protein [Antrihabitans cavernicola]|uniref:Twin-arginine translocation signal domain-containing protein n=1 Tax=Antrihabitans cavernicola TaxID=2495913 RepID=A0A5A7S178_9NOCA|nr:hypothetical protein [Spelaeibacter cavernicola]KAA0016559.1 hypothetical protein FOY51_26060 [Spelaeibacter cavernicola]
MSKTSRRLFLRRATLAASAATVAATSSQLWGSTIAEADPADPATQPAHPVELGAPLVALLRDAKTGEFTVMVADREVVFTNKRLAAALTHAVAGSQAS